MKNSYNKIKLKEFLSIDNTTMTINPTESYVIAGVQNYGKGVVNKRIVVGADLTMTKYKVIKNNQLLWCKVDTKNGAFGITTLQNEKSIVSTNMYLANIDNKIINPDYLSYFFIDKAFCAKLDSLAQGTTNRRYASLEQILNIEIDLPNIEEQDRIVKKIKIIRDKIERIQELRQQVEKEINNLRYSLMCDIENEYSFSPINKICDIKKGLFPIMKTEAGKYPFVVTGAEFKTANNFDFDTEAVCVPLVSSTGHGNAAMHRVHYVKGKFALSNLLCAVTPKNKDEVNTQYLYELFMAKKDEYFVPLMIGTSNVSLSVDKIGTVKIPIPPIKKQNELVCLLEKLNIIKQQHKFQEIELNDLIPSLLDKAFKGDLFSVSETIDTNPIQQEQSVIPENKRRFAKQVLGGKIVALFKDDKNFTSIKFQKLQYLAEHIIEEDLCWNYYRQSAGPYDNKFMHSVVSNFERNKWFKQQDYKYYPLEKVLEIEQYYQNYFGKKSDKLSHLFGLLSNASERFCEAVATIYAVWNNHLIQQLPFNKERIKVDFFEWSTRKEDIFSEDDFERAINWMQKHNIIPTGFGHLIKEKK